MKYLFALLFLTSNLSFATSASKKFKSVPELISAIEQMLKEDRLTRLDLIKLQRKNLPSGDIPHLELADHKKLIEKQKQVPYLKKRQYTELLSVKLGMPREKIISLYKTSENDNFNDPSKFKLNFIVRDAFSDIAWVNDKKGGVLDFPFTFYFSSDNKLNKISVAVPGEKILENDIWIVE